MDKLKSCTDRACMNLKGEDWLSEIFLQRLTGILNLYSSIELKHTPGDKITIRIKKQKEKAK